MKPVWQTRTGSGLHPLMEAYSQTALEDEPFVLHDLHGSAAHVEGLAHVGLLQPDEAGELLAGLAQIKQDFLAGKWSLDAALEDVHMNIESTLAELPAGGKLHSGRSRNDQVATCIVLYAREALVGVAAQAHALAAALHDQATVHVETPWVAKTHGQPAQPATLGWLLQAHAFRFQDLTKHAIQTFQAIGESPLGSGAVAGSTLPLDPAYTAELLGLRSPRSALLSSGARDPILKALAVTTQAGLFAASLAQDLIDLFQDQALQLPEGFTSGSSLMPHKRNPDALELVRGKGKALPGIEVQLHGLIAGLGLGYQRDLQASKPLLVQATQEAQAALEVLTACVEGARFDMHALAASLGAPGITATDAAEALVADGMPFRTAYGHLAAIYAQVETGASLDQAVQSIGLEPEQETAVIAALHPAPSRRQTLGAPAAWEASFAAFAAVQETEAVALASAQTQIAIPAALLEDG